MQRTNHQPKKIAVPKKKQEHVLRAITTYGYTYHIAWGDIFFLYQMNDEFYDQNREKTPWLLEVVGDAVANC